VPVRERLIQFRKHLKLSQQAFAERIGMSQSTYAPLEKSREIRDAYVKLICNVYCVNEQWLRYGEGEMLSDKVDNSLNELLDIYDGLPSALQRFMLKQAKELQILQDEMKKQSE
jgi:transcriptional regulator with XRE-family HTH domain